MCCILQYSGDKANTKDRKKLNERIRLGSQSDAMESILNNKDGMVYLISQTIPKQIISTLR